MEKLRTYGSSPFNLAVIHGGPGAPGEAAPIARELASIQSVLEPFQSADTCEGQVQELRAILEENAGLPVILVGHSWGAMLSFLLAARYPALVKKMVMVSSAVFEDEYTAEIEVTRLMRLDDDEKVEAITLMDGMNDPGKQDKDTLLKGFLEILWTKADSFDPLPLVDETLEYQFDINIRVAEDAKKLRISGELLELGTRVTCPVVAIHGDYDPHPAEGVRKPLSRVVRDFRFILLEKCGHFPWLERQARDKFYEILKREIG